MRRRAHLDPNQWVGLYVVGGAFVIFYVFLSCEMIALGYRIQKAESRYHELMVVNQNYRAELERLTAPQSIKQLLEQHGMSMAVPDEWCFQDIEVPDESPVIGLSHGKAEANPR